MSKLTEALIPEDYEGISRWNPSEVKIIVGHLYIRATHISTGLAVESFYRKSSDYVATRVKLLRLLKILVDNEMYLCYTRSNRRSELC